MSRKTEELRASLRARADNAATSQEHAVLIVGMALIEALEDLLQTISQQDRPTRRARAR